MRGASARRAARIAVRAWIGAAALLPVQAGGNGEVRCQQPYLPNPTCEKDEIADISWSPHALPVRWWMNEAAAGPNIDQGGMPISPASALSELEASFAAWEELPESSITFDSMGMTPAFGAGADNRNLVYWSEDELDDSTLEITTWSIIPIDVIVGPTTRNWDPDPEEELDRDIYPDGATLRAGTIIDADVTMNSGYFDWALTPDPTGGICDIRAVATHGAGHVQGLTHSPALRDAATMFAFFDTSSSRQQEIARTLKGDDIASSARTYPVEGVGPRGAISGRVVGSNGTGVVGAQVSAVDLLTGREVGSVFSSSASKASGGGAGAYRLDRLPAGQYMVSVDYIRRAGHTNTGWRWLNNRDDDPLISPLYNLTVGLASLDPAFVRPELLSIVEDARDDLRPPLVITLAEGEERTGPDLNLVANELSPPVPVGTQLQLDDTGVIDEIPIGFDFYFFGVRYRYFAAYANGYVTFRNLPPDTPTPPLDTSFDESGLNFFDLPRIAGLLRDLDPGADGTSSGGQDAYVRLGAASAETTWVVVPEKVPPFETGSTSPTRHGANTFTIGFDSSNQVWIQYQKVSAPFGIAGLAAGSGSAGVRVKYDFGRPRPDPRRPTLENAVRLSGVRIDFTPHPLGGYVATSPQWSVPEVAPPSGGLRLEALGDINMRLVWPAIDATRYHVYRGRVSELRATGAYTDLFSCFTRVEAPEATDTGDPGFNEVFYYLVTGVREFGIEGPFGQDSRGDERRNAVPCRVR